MDIRTTYGWHTVDIGPFPGWQTTDIWRIYGGHAADMQWTYGGHTADRRLTYGRSPADIRQIYGWHTAEILLIYGRISAVCAAHYQNWRNRFLFGRMSAIVGIMIKMVDFLLTVNADSNVFMKQFWLSCNWRFNYGFPRKRFWKLSNNKHVTRSN